MTRYLRLFILFWAIISNNIYIVAQDIVINEIMPANVSFLLDGTYNYNGWVELYNNGKSSVNLTGYSLTDDYNNPRKYIFPKSIGSIAPKEYKIIFFDNNDLDANNVNFKLDCDGAYLYLYSNDSILQSFVNYGYSYPNLSYARKKNGSGTWATCIKPTPGKSNDNGEYSVKRSEKPRVNVAPGIYYGNLIIKLESSEGSIRYTTDGSEPNERSKVWNSNMAINSTTVIRARTYKKGCIPSEILTCTYIIDENRLFDLPVVSIVTDPENLWSDSLGIYCDGTNGVTGNGVSYPVNYNRDWRRPCNVEIFNNPHDKYVSQQCDISIGGGWSRSYPLKSLELNAEKKYEGRNSFDVRLFAQKPYYRFKSLTLRNSGNDFYNSMFSDAMQQHLYAGNVDIDYLAYQPVVHFINGEYYGIINIRERSNHHHVNSNWGYDKENLDFAYNSADGNDMLGDKVALNELDNLVGKGDYSASQFRKINNLLDVDEYINYIVIQSFSANTDWMSNNVKFYRSRDEGRFRWILFDLDHGFNNLNYNQFTATDRSGLTNKNAYTGKLFQGLKNNPNFRDKFIDHATAIIGGIMREERFNAIIDSIAGLITQEIPYHRKRWGNSYDITGYANSFKNYANKRREVYASQVASYFSLGEPLEISIKPTVKTALYINGVEVPTGVFEGYMHKGRGYTLSVDVPYGYKFKEWNIAPMDPDQPIENILEKINKRKTQIEIEFGSISYNFVPTFERLDSLYDHLVPAVRINELGANKEITYNDYFKKSDWVELYNRTDSVFDIAGLYISNNEENPRLYKIPDNLGKKSCIEPHGFCVLWADEELDRREFHLPFKLPSSGGRLILSAYDESDTVLLWRDEIEYRSHNDDRSFGRYPNGSDKLHVLHHPTPCFTNLYSSYNTLICNDTITGYQINEVITDIMNVDEEVAEVVEVKYYNLSGLYVGNIFEELPQGIYIRRILFDNNKVKSEKIIKR
ncbi:MAG: hypothetical protein E7089_06300 [Bacteroidales bacterium]|nr:hypothetical protein [Bacteroidales bacterium]